MMRLTDEHIEKFVQDTNDKVSLQLNSGIEVLKN
jgi:hypothetical protein